MFSAVMRSSGAFLCFALPDSFSTVPRASGPILTFCAPGLIFGGTGCVGSRFHVLFSQTRFRRYRWRRVPFSCFSRPYSFSAVPRTSSPIFMCLHARTCFRQYRWLWVPFSCFALPYSFSTVSRPSGPIFMFCASVLVFGGTEGVRSRFMFCAPGLIFDRTESVGSCFHVLRSRNRFRRFRGRRVPFSCFALPDSFSTVTRASTPDFMF
jgi:hypothetical protein